MIEEAVQQNLGMNVAAWLAVALMLLKGYLMFRDVLDKEKPNPPAGQVYATKERVTRVETQLTKEIQEVEAKVDGVDTDLKAYKDEMVRKGDARKEEVLAKINEHRKEQDRHYQRVQDRLNNLGLELTEKIGELKGKTS